ncbi:MAG: LptF/LptG family permease [Bdellovibrionales bacterium]|nr:LptF/LptG family permease [Bdellovibrionales bacterium]
MTEEAPAMRTDPPRKSFLKGLLPISFDRYLAVEVMGPFLGGVVFFTFILLMFQMLRLASAMIEHSVPLPILLKIVWYLSVTFMPIVLPLAFLLSVLVAFGRLSADSELVALKANGMSMHRLALPVFLLAFVVAAGSLALNMEWAPRAKIGWRSTLIRLTNTTPIATIRENTFTTGFFGLLVFAEKVDSKTNRLANIFIYDDRDPRAARAIVAPVGEIIPIKTSSDLGASITLKLYDGEIHHNDTASLTYQKTTFREYRVNLAVAAGADNAVGNFLNYTIEELLHVDRATLSPRMKNELSTEIFSRWLTALTPIFFALIGMGLGTVRGRGTATSAGLVSLLVIIPTYILQMVGQNAGYTGTLPPFLAMLIPDLFLLVLGFWAYRRAVW